MNRILAIVSAAIAHRYPHARPEITPDTQLADHCDEIDRQTIAQECDDAFGIEIADRELAAWGTVADVIATVERSKIDA
jgi:acyl carrier protein